MTAHVKRQSVGWGKEPENYARDRVWHDNPVRWRRLLLGQHFRKWEPAQWVGWSSTARGRWRPGGWVYATTLQYAREAIREHCGGG